MKHHQSKSKSNKIAKSITLRPFKLSDVDDLMVWAADEVVGNFCEWDPKEFTSKVYAKKFIASLTAKPYYKAICINGRAIGDISVAPPRGECYNACCRAEIGYVVALDYWGKGIATKAVKMVVSEIFEKWPNLERIEGKVDVENVASQRVLEKCGFKREGVLRKYKIHKGRAIDVVMFSLLSTDDRHHPR